jgi:hypothetical protein
VLVDEVATVGDGLFDPAERIGWVTRRDEGRLCHLFLMLAYVT